MDVSASSKDKNQHIKVFVRVRPLDGAEKTKNILEVSGSRELMVKERPQDRNSRKFTFDKVFGPNADQVDVYRSVVSPLVSEVLAGYNCTVFAYGQTGTGKTFTMEGDRTNDCAMLWYEDPKIGIIPRALSHLFNELRLLQAEYSVKVSFLELYNEELLDLLSPADDSSKIKLYEDATKKGAVIVHGLQEVTVRSKNEVYGIMEKGSQKRQTAATMLNAHSSRSHTIFTITVHIKENSVEGDELIKLGKLNLVDLAGSENIGRSGATEKRAREAGNINQSLLTLGRVITSLVERAPHVPYRESKLTRLLQESLGGRTKTSIIATVSPHFSNMEETISTLEYAHRAKNIQNKPEINQKLAKKALIKEYTEEIDRLQKDLMACRERNGFYVAEENYKDMLTQIEMQKTEMAEMISSMTDLRACLEEKEKLNTELSMSLADYHERLGSALLELERTRGHLHKTIRERNEKEHIIEHHMTTEQRLLRQAESLLAATDVSTKNNDNLHSSLDRRRILENDNSVTCHNFSNNMKQALENMKLRMENLHQQESDFSASIKKRLDGSCKEIQNWSNVAEQRVSSMIAAHIQMVKSLDVEVQQLDPSIETMNHCRTAVQNERQEYHKCYKDMSDFIQKQMLDLQLELAQIHKENEALQTEVTAMMEVHRRNQDDLVRAGRQSIAELKASMVDKLDEVLSNLEQDRTAMASIEDTKSSMVRDIQEAVQRLMTIATYTATKLDSSSQVLRKRNTLNNDKVVDVKTNLEQTELPVISQLLSDTDATCSFVDERLKQFNERTSLTEKKIEQNSTESMQHITTVMSSQSEAVKEHVQFLDNNLANVMDRITTTQGSHMEQSKNFIRELESTVEHHKEIRNIPVALVDTLSTECSADVDAHCLPARAACGNFIGDMEQLDRSLETFIQDDLRIYVASGQTPERQELVYPRIFKATSPHERIIERFRSMKEEEGEQESSNSEVTLGSGSEEDTLPPRLGQSSSTSDIPGSSAAQIPNSISAPNILLIDEKENSSGKEECLGVTKNTRVRRKPRKILSARN